MDDIETFEKTDAGASTTTPIQAGNVKKGTIALLKGFPCKVNIIKSFAAFTLLLKFKKECMYMYIYIYIYIYIKYLYLGRRSFNL